ncbi:MAG: hypothetical protein WA989_02395 [Henriciella sp.]|uniref:hypothetical protein n=1 Tax=Henriciella sp. TaxID=1968823 RepID=UPI003C71D81D
MKPRQTLLAAFVFAALAACGGPAENEAAKEAPTPPADTDLAELPGSEPATGAQTQPDDPATVAAAKEACSTLSADGLCNIEFGMSESEARAAYPGDLNGDARENTSCYYLLPAGAGYGTAFMMVDGSVKRIDIRDTSVATAAGAKVGMLLDEIDDLYPGGTRTPNKYAPANEDLKVDLGDGVFAIFEEGNQGRVRAYRLGIEPAVSFVEGCA